MLVIRMIFQDFQVTCVHVSSDVPSLVIPDLQQKGGLSGPMSTLVKFM